MTCGKAVFLQTVTVFRGKSDRNIVTVRIMKKRKARKQMAKACTGQRRFGGGGRAFDPRTYGLHLCEIVSVLAA
jgi:hypothetical protein